MDNLEDKYYTVPVEIYRHFLDNPIGVLNDVVDYLAAHKKNGQNQTLAESELGVKFGNWKQALNRGKFLWKQEYNGTVFSIPRKMYWDCYNHIETKSTNDLLDILAYLALKTRLGKNKLRAMTTGELFMLMAGYGCKLDFEKRNEELGAIGKYFENERKQRDVGLRIRNRLEAKHQFYHIKGNRNFVYTFSDRDKRSVYTMLARYVEEHKRSNRERVKREIIAEVKAGYDPNAEPPIVKYENTT